MFGFVTANMEELTSEQKKRYSAVYCGICRQIRLRHSGLARLGLRYDMAFLAMLLMSLYEPEEVAGTRACGFHQLRPRHWVDNVYVQYGADMNVALAYYNARDDIADDGGLTPRLLAANLEKSLTGIQEQYPRQCRAMERCIRALNELEAAGCDNPDIPAGCFGELMGELLAYQEDLWASPLRQMGMALGRFIYLADAAVDYRRDKRKKRYNPYITMDTGEDYTRWEQYLVLAMGRCTEAFEKLPLVQDKAILDNILYSGVWAQYGRRRPRAAARREKDGGSL